METDFSLIKSTYPSVKRRDGPCQLLVCMRVSRLTKKAALEHTANDLTIIYTMLLSRNKTYSVLQAKMHLSPYKGDDLEL